MAGQLSDADHDLMDSFFGALFEEVRAGELRKDDFIELVAFAMTAVDIGQHDVAVDYFQNRIRRKTAVRAVS